MKIGRCVLSNKTLHLQVFMFVVDREILPACLCILIQRSKTRSTYSQMYYWWWGWHQFCSHELYTSWPIRVHYFSPSKVLKTLSTTGSSKADSCKKGRCRTVFTIFIIAFVLLTNLWNTALDNVIARKNKTCRPTHDLQPRSNNKTITTKQQWAILRLTVSLQQS